MNFEMGAMAMAMTMMGVVVVVKVATSRMLGQMRQAIERLDSERHQWAGTLSAAKMRRKTAERNKIVLQQKKAKLQKKIDRLHREIKAMQEERTKQERKRAAMRGEVDAMLPDQEQA